jgi:hypothetical protein
MKPRNREINIFNMSLLDVLCGALGAFCFMMLVLFPYYSQDKGVAKAPEVPPAGVDPKTYDQAMARIKELEDLVKKFQSYSDQAEAQEKREEAEIRQLQNDMNDAKEKIGQLEMRKPILSVGRFALSAGDYVQVFIEDDRTGQSGKKAARVDPTKPQDINFTGDFATQGEGVGLSYFLVRDAPAGEYRVFAKIIKHPSSNQQPIRGFVTVEVEGGFQVSPDLVVSQEHIAIPIAVVTVDQDKKQTIKIVVPKEFAVPADAGKK